MSTPKEGEDAELLEAWRGGDKAAGSVLIRRYSPRLLSFYNGKVSATTAEDLCQQTLAYCVQARDRIEEDDGKRSFRAFVFTVARGRLLNYYRKFRNNDERVDPLRSSVARMTGGFSDVMVVKQRKERVQTALANLAIDAQVALELFYWQDLTNSEIAEVLEVPVGTVKARISRARQQLREMLGESGDFDLSQEK